MSELIHAPKCTIQTFKTRFYLENALAGSTRKAYRADLEHFLSAGRIIPATPETVADYLSRHAGLLAVATLQRRLVSISKAHTMQGYADPVKTEIVRLTFRGIRRTHAKKQKQAAALMKDDLLTILRQMPGTSKGRRDKAVLIVGFAAGLRRSEIVGLDINDIDFVPKGMTITLHQSKTDRLREGRVIAIPFGRTDVCPVQILKDWLAVLPDQGGPVFRPIAKGGRISGQRLSDHAVSDLVKFYARKIGLNAEEFSGHSIRAGLVSSCAQAGIATWIIKRTTGHKSEEMLQRYIRPVEAFSYNAAGLLF
jgi:integrase